MYTFFFTGLLFKKMQREKQKWNEIKNKNIFGY
jgi:hypothetical protein